MSEKDSLLRLLKERRIVLASLNQNKVQELVDLLYPLGYSCYSAKDCGVKEPAETGATFEENAKIKAINAAVHCKAPAIADDSGLCVDALKGAPGIHSSRWAQANGSYEKAFLALLELLEDNMKSDIAFVPRACFQCSIVVAWPDKQTRSFEGRVDGRLVFPPRGKDGFGYDPIFLPDENNHKNQTFAEMPIGEKNLISHRARAIKQFIRMCAVGSER